MRKIFAIAFLCCCMLAVPSSAFAHSALCACMDNGDETVTCEGGYSDGSSAAGVSVTVYDSGGNVLVAGVMSQDSEFTFEKPQSDYKIVFDAGDSHRIEVDGKNIVE